VGAVKATAPDGRNWEIEAIREPFSFEDVEPRALSLLSHRNI
jgi:hypothetical protein